MKIYIVNLDRDTDRMAHMSSIMRDMGLDYERVSACDGSLMPKEEVETFIKSRPLKRDWLLGEVGCFKSHFSIWEKIAAGAEKYAAVLEDDVHVAPAIKHILSDDSWLPADFDVVRLEPSTNRLRLDKKPASRVLGRDIFRLRSTSWGTGGYVINREAARRLIAMPEKLHHAADTILFSYEATPIAKGLVVYQFSPALVVQDKFLKNDPRRRSFASRIGLNEDEEDLPTRLLKTGKKINFLIIHKTIHGYKRVSFSEEQAGYEGVPVPASSENNAKTFRPFSS